MLESGMGRNLLCNRHIIFETLQRTDLLVARHVAHSKNAKNTVTKMIFLLVLNSIVVQYIMSI